MYVCLAMCSVCGVAAYVPVCVCVYEAWVYVLISSYFVLFLRVYSEFIFERSGEMGGRWWVYHGLVTMVGRWAGQGVVANWSFHLSPSVSNRLYKQRPGDIGFQMPRGWIIGSVGGDSRTGRTLFPPA